MITTTRLANGLIVIVEEMGHVESAAYDLLIPGGLTCDAPDTLGASLILPELMARGAGPYDSRGLSEAFDDLGVRHGEGVGLDKFALSGVLVADKISPALELVSQMVLEPHLPDAEIPNIASVLLQDLDALNDNPARRAMVELSSRYYPAPFNRSSLGEAQGIKNTVRSTVQRLHDKYFRPDRAILSVAGRVEAKAILALAEKLFGGWSGCAEAVPEFGELPPTDYFSVEVESSQQQIVLAAPSIKFGREGYFSGKVALAMLGSSMFGRLFLEVREKRGLCYSVYARHGANNSYGTVTAYVGTTPERAQESLDVLLAELGKLKGTVAEEELTRAKTNLKATLVMGEESPGSRASSNATDWWLLGRVRTLQEISSQIDLVTIASVDEFLQRFPFIPCSILSLGPKKLEVPGSVVGKS